MPIENMPVYTTPGHAASTPAQVPHSTSNAANALASAQTIYCARASWKGSRSGASRPTVMTCSAHMNAPASTQPSPGARRSPPWTLSRYNPAAASPAPVQQCQPTRSRHIAVNSNGTMTVYSPVIKPALPAVV